MDDEPRDDLWWLPWHWNRRQWSAAMITIVLLSFAAGLMLAAEILGRLMGID